MRIALLTETFLPDVNGVVTTLCHLLEHLNKRGHEALVFAPHGAPTSFANAEIVPLAGMPLPIYPDLKLTPPQIGMTARLRAFQPDVLHLAGTMLLSPAGCAAAQRLGLPLVAVYHTDWPAYAGHYGMGWMRGPAYHYLRLIHARCALTLCPSRATMHDLRSHGFRRLRMWGRGVDTTLFHPRRRSASWRASIGAQPGETVVLSVGRLANEKRLDLLVQALPQLTNVRLVFVGDGPARPELERRLAGQPAHFTGYLRGEALATAYASADMFVFPSDTDTFGQVIREAMASGLPVVAARAGGALDLVSEGETGFLVPPGDAIGFQRCIARLAANPNQQRSMGLAGRQRAERRSWECVMDEMVGHYERVLRHRSLYAARIAGSLNPALRTPS